MDASHPVACAAGPRCSISVPIPLACMNHESALPVPANSCEDLLAEFGFNQLVRKAIALTSKMHSSIAEHSVSDVLHSVGCRKLACSSDRHVAYMERLFEIRAWFPVSLPTRCIASEHMEPSKTAREPSLSRSHHSRKPVTSARDTSARTVETMVLTNCALFGVGSCSMDMMESGLDDAASVGCSDDARDVGALPPLLFLDPELELKPLAVSGSLETDVFPRCRMWCFPVTNFMPRS